MVAIVASRIDTEIEGLVLVRHNKPVNRFAHQLDVALLVHAVDARRGGLGDHLHLIDRIFENELAPVIKL